MTHSIALQLDSPAISLEKNGDSSRYVLHAEQDGIKVEINLSGFGFEALVRQGQALIPSPNNTLTTPEVEAIHRQSAWPLKRLDGKGWQLLLREIDSDSLLVVLWYLKDADLAKTVTRNMSQRAGAMLADDLVSRFQGRDPDRVPVVEVESAHLALENMISLINRLADEGQILEFRS